jgi:hypothetical protein
VHALKVFIIACSAAVIIAIIGGIVLSNVQDAADEAFSTSAVRLSR